MWIVPGLLDKKFVLGEFYLFLNTPCIDKMPFLLSKKDSVVSLGYSYWGTILKKIVTKLSLNSISSSPSHGKFDMYYLKKERESKHWYVLFRMWEYNICFFRNNSWHIFAGSLLNRSVGCHNFFFGFQTINEKIDAFQGLVCPDRFDRSDTWAFHRFYLERYLVSSFSGNYFNNIY